MNSADPRVAEEAIAEASKFGVGFFVLNWSPLRAKQNENVTAFTRATNLSDIKFCLLYGISDLGFDPGSESTPVTPRLEATFDANLVLLAGKYFSNPSYLRVHGRPVLVLYLARTLTGDVRGLMAGARRVMKAHGVDPFFIGDEVFWRVTAVDAPTDTLDFTQVPQTKRIRLFDAITGRDEPGGR